MPHSPRPSVILPAQTISHLSLQIHRTSLTHFPCSGRERYSDLASLLVIAVSTGVDLEVDGALSSPVATVVAKVVRKGGNAVISG